MKHICWVLISIAALAVGWPSAFGSSELTRRPRQLTVAPSVADNLALLFSQFETELVLCLEGEFRGDDLYVTDFRMPHIFVSESGRVQAAGCPTGSKTLGTWHNHPPRGLGLVAASPPSLTRNCYLSRTDIKDFLRRKQAEVTVVSCGPRTFAYWWRRDVDLVDEDVAVLPPPTTQLVEDHSRKDPETGALTQARSR